MKKFGFEEVNNFAVAQTANSTNLNPKIARFLGIEHVGCHNHCLNLGCKEMENNYLKLREIVEKTGKCHRTIGASNKLTACLENE